MQANLDLTKEEGQLLLSNEYSTASFHREYVSKTTNSKAYIYKMNSEGSTYFTGINPANTDPLYDFEEMEQQ